MDNTSIFTTLNSINVSDKSKEKNGLSYLPWASTWALIKKSFPDATYQIYPQVLDTYGNSRFWHDDGKTGWVEVGVTINGVEMKETLAIMDYHNKSIPAENITSADANKSVKRCMVKACALHGLGLYIYEGEDLPEEETKINEIRDSIRALIEKKIKISDNAKEKVAQFCKEAESEAYPALDKDLITGNYKKINDLSILKHLEAQLLTIRK